MTALASRGNRRVPDKQQMKAYLAQGMTQQQIADAWAEHPEGARVTRNAIGMAMQRYNLKPANPVPRYDAVLPWRVRQEHLTDYNARMLRLEGRRLKRRKLDPDEKRRLDSWKKALAEMDRVVHYDPRTTEGFFWVPREPADEGLLIRHPDRHPED